ncbi:MAG: class I SAM-dependent methyltransferase, partial [Hadesarchaea archaeon]|nr:class I SAM-dependent methyltransferase [Hadesarchaea archaeon]
MSIPKFELRRRYDLTAGAYDRRYEEIQRKKYDVVMENLPRVCRVLDLGCGTGMLFQLLVERADFVVGVDIARGMLRLARSRANERVALVQADADLLPFADESFDAVVSITMLQNVPNPAATMKEIARVLRIGGMAIITSLKHKHSPDQLRDWAVS